MMGPWAPRLGGPSPAGPMESAPMSISSALVEHRDRRLWVFCEMRNAKVRNGQLRNEKAKISCEIPVGKLRNKVRNLQHLFS